MSRKLTTTLVSISAVLLTTGCAVFAFLYAELDNLENYSPPTVSQVYSEDGTQIGNLWSERRELVSVDRIPVRLIQAFVAAEDRNFFRHRGVDYLAVCRAAVKDVLSFSKKEGASTITQQVARAMQLSSRKDISRKVKEVILAKQIESNYSKKEILYLYLNQIYLGSGAYGVQSASQTYFGKDVKDVSLAEMAMLAGLTKAPEIYSPVKHPERAIDRQRYVLERMVKDGYITAAEKEAALRAPLILVEGRKNNDIYGYFLDHIRTELIERYGEELVRRGGLKIYTTLDADMQKAALENMVSGLKAIDKRQGFRGPVETVTQEGLASWCAKADREIGKGELKAGESYKGVVVGFGEGDDTLRIRVGNRHGTLSREAMDWAGDVSFEDGYGPGDRETIRLGSVLEVTVLKPGKDRQEAVFALDQTPTVQGALVAIDPATGAVKAMIGGYSYRNSPFNRATQARRNPGSAFKPLIYAAALDKGMSQWATVQDAPLSLPDGRGGLWQPKNHDGRFRGAVSMRTALSQSINVASVRILEATGVDFAIRYARKLGIASPLQPNLTLALGSSSVTPLELTTAYAVLANGGRKVTPYCITKLVASDGKVLEERKEETDTGSADADKGHGADREATDDPDQIIPRQTALTVTDMLRNVISSGTGQRARSLGRPAAGKTGTTNNSRDAWFIGFVPQLVTGVWVGQDSGKTLGPGGSGGTAAVPIWTGFMKEALTDEPVVAFARSRGSADEVTGTPDDGEELEAAETSEEPQPAIPDAEKVSSDAYTGPEVPP